jgi:hypothetical protein
MNFLVDGSVDGPMMDRLREDGYDVLPGAEIEPSLPYETVLAMANQRDALTLTADIALFMIGYGRMTPPGRPQPPSCPHPSPAGSGKVLTKGGDHRRVFGESQAFSFKKGLG